MSQIGAGEHRAAANNAVVRGWCPDAWRPMRAGDGLLVRVKPRLARLSGEALGILCQAAMTYGNGLIDMTRRANLQIRGVSETGWRPLLDQLLHVGLVDSDPKKEGARTMLVAPDWREGDDTHRIASELLDRLDELPELPGKMGFSIDVGTAPTLLNDPGDFRLERAVDGGIMLRADGRADGVAVPKFGEVDALIALAHWVVASGGRAAGRMARHDAPLPAWASGSVKAASPKPPILPGYWDGGMAYALPFGRVEARDLMQAGDIRLTPWRILLAEGEADAVASSALSSDPVDSLMRIEACPGAPACPQASVETRDLARRLAPHVDGRLHVSGCAKGCACSSPTDVVLTGTEGRYDLAFAACAGSPPVRSGLTPADLLAHFGAC